jgi:hypothetical protein
MRRTKMRLASTTVDFTKVFSELNDDVSLLLKDPSAKPKNDMPKLHLFVYRLCTCRCTNVPHVSWYGGHSMEGQEQPQTLYYLHRQKVQELIIDTVKQVLHRNQNYNKCSLMDSKV